MIWVVLIFGIAGLVDAKNTDQISGNPPIEIARYKDQFSNVQIEPAKMNNTSGLAVNFIGTDDFHFYARSETAPVAGFELQVDANSDSLEFGKAIFPEWEFFQDPLGKRVEIFAGRFTVFIPIKKADSAAIDPGQVQIRISGQLCTSTICLRPFEKKLSAKIDWSEKDTWKKIDLGRTKTTALYSSKKTTNAPVFFALGLAFLAGLSLNIMPCVWPVLPLIVMRIVAQAKADKNRSIAMGLAFCLGILLFFACLAGANVILQLVYGTVLQWGDQFRNPAVVAALALLLVVMALFMFGVFTIGLPSSVASKTGTGKGFTGAIGMGFLAAILSTPCSFAILATAFAWAQAQKLAVGTLAIMVIGLGMATPYAILTSLPGLLKKLPKAGRWMELFKQAIGFILLAIAVKLIAALPETRTMNVIYFAVAMAFCVWMWGSWVTYSTRPVQKWTVRIIAVVLVTAAGYYLLKPAAPQIIDWQPYDSEKIEKTIAEDKPVLIDFTADWCFSCQVVKKIVYGRKDIAELIKTKNVLAIRADTTQNNFPATIALKEKYAEPGVPVSILFVPGEKEPIRWRGLIFADELKGQLRQLK